MLALHVLVLVLAPLASGQPAPTNCCETKTVGGVSYTFVREDSAAIGYSCLSPCVYERDDQPGTAFCFAQGDQQVVCGDSPGLEGGGSSKLQNDEMCGITTGGQDECWWDCLVISDQLVSGQAIANPECLSDCFSKNGGTSCLAGLIEDVTSKGTCDDGRNPASTLNIWGWAELDNNCTLKEVSGGGDYDGSGDYGSGGDYYDYKRDSGSGDYGSGDDNYDYYSYGTSMEITEGTCSSSTEAALQTAECLACLAKLPTFVKSTLQLLIQHACRSEVYTAMPFSQFQNGRKKKKFKQKRTKGRLAPISQVNLDANTRTELNFENTRHRYPWICSLRAKGVNQEHLCAVNLLAVPPNPTVIVGSAHCTYLCKDTDASGVTLPSCCCVDSNFGQESCSDDKTKCFSDPRIVEMDGSDVEILCGEWETGQANQSTSGEEYNVVLPILDIIRSPDFEAGGRRPAGGADIAVFKVNDAGFQNSRDLKIFPACLPPKDREPPLEGVHSGWTKPPTLSFIEKYAGGYNESYEDFFKQWHYKMEIQESCADPVKTQVFGLNVKFPSNTYYPPATVCALDVTSQSCFSTGDSGSPLMVKEENRPRYYIEGVLSFVKGCEQFGFGARNTERTKFELLQNSENPAAYTKLSCHLPWVAEQYGLSYDPAEDENCDKGTGPSPPYDTVCRETKGSDLLGKEYPCIFPFYYKGNGPYNQCMLFDEEDFVYPVFRCPVRNITTKYPGTDINHFEDALETLDGYCYNFTLAAETCDPELEDGGPGCQRLLDPTTDCPAFLKIPPFSTCKNDCPGVRSFGIIGGGGVMFS